MERDRNVLITVICLFTIIISVVFIVANFSYIIKVWEILVNEKKTFRVKILFRKEYIFIFFFIVQFFASLLMLFGSKFGLFTYMFAMCFNCFYFLTQLYLKLMKGNPRLKELAMQASKVILASKLNLLGLVIPILFLIYFQFPSANDFYRTHRFFWFKTLVIMFLAGLLVYFMPQIMIKVT